MEKEDEAQAMAKKKGGRNRQKGDRKGIIIFLFTRSTTGTPASI